jgi:hypothetical protein
MARSREPYAMVATWYAPHEPFGLRGSHDKINKSMHSNRYCQAAAAILFVAAWLGKESCDMMRGTTRQRSICSNVYWSDQFSCVCSLSQ